MIGSYSDDEIYADNRHLQCQLKKEQAVVKHLESRIRDLEASLAHADEALHDAIVEKDMLFDESVAGYASRDQRIAELEDQLSELEDAAHYCVGKGRLDDALEEWRAINKMNRQ